MADDTDLHALSCRAMMDMPRIRPVLDKIADKWTIMILTVLCPEPARFNEIKRRLDGITHKSLADALKRLERHGLVTRTVIPTTPIGVRYTITPLGHSLREPFEALCSWALKHEAAFSHDHDHDHDHDSDTAWRSDPSRSDAILHKNYYRPDGV